MSLIPPPGAPLPGAVPLVGAIPLDSAIPTDSARNGVLPVGASERRDAARNRGLLLQAARELVEERGADGLTMAALAERAGVGKGTVFRRFGSRAGLMMTLLSDAESEFQGRFMFGPPPLGPGAQALERLVAFGVERISWVLEYGELARAAGVSAYNRFDVPAAVLCNRHLDMLLREAGVTADPWLMAASLSATLEPERLLYAVHVHGMAAERLALSWSELVSRVARAA